MLQVDLDAIKLEIDKSGMKLQSIAEKMFISRATLYSSLSGRREFTLNELNALCQILCPENPDSMMQIFLRKKLAVSQLTEA